MLFQLSNAMIFYRSKKQLLETGLDSLKTASKKVVHKSGEFLGNKNCRRSN